MKKHALVVDNDFFFVEFFKEILQQRGYEVLKAYDGKEGITRLKTCPVDLLFVDMVMPKIDGKQLIQCARELFPDAPFPIVAISGTLIDQLEDIQFIGADFFLAKGPVGAMAEHINRFLDRLEEQPFPFLSDPELQEPIQLFPRQSSAEMIAVMDFQDAFFNSIGLGVFVADKDAVIIKANETGLELLKKTMGEVLNCHVTKLLPVSEKPRFIGALKKVALQRGLRHVSIPVTMDLKKIGITVSLLNLNQEAVGWVVVMQDLTQWKDAFQQPEA